MIPSHRLHVFITVLLAFSLSGGWSLNNPGYHNAVGVNRTAVGLSLSWYRKAAGNSKDLKALESSVNGPTNLAYDKEGFLYIVESVQRRLLRLDLKRGLIEVVIPEPAGRSFSYPDAVVSDQHGIVYITDFNGRLRKLDTRSGDISVLIPLPARLIDSQLEGPGGMTIDADGNVLVSGEQRHKVFRWRVDAGKLEIEAGTRAGFGGDGGLASNSMLHFPMGLAVDQSGDLFIADYESCRIRKVDHQTNIIDTVAGTGECASKGDGDLATRAGLNYPSSLVLDHAGNLFFVEGAKDRVREIDKNGFISTYVGNGQKGFSGDGGPADKAKLNNPSGLAVDLEGNLYISEYMNNRIRRVDAVTHEITTVAGNGGPGRDNSVM